MSRATEAHSWNYWQQQCVEKCAHELLPPSGELLIPQQEQGGEQRRTDVEYQHPGFSEGGEVRLKEVCRLGCPVCDGDRSIVVVTTRGSTVGHDGAVGHHNMAHELADEHRSDRQHNSEDSRSAQASQCPHQKIEEHRTQQHRDEPTRPWQASVGAGVGKQCEQGHTDGYPSGHAP